MNQPDSTQQFSRDYNLDLLRILAAFFVIVIHIANSGLMEGRCYEVGSLYFIVCTMVSELSRWCVPVFVMISGSIFLNSSKIISFKTLFSKYILRIFTSLILWSFFYSWYFKSHYFPLATPNVGIQLWYLPMIIGVYLTIPITQSLTARNQKYFIIIWFVFLCIEFLNKITNNIYSIVKIDDTFFLNYVGYFVLGNLLYHQQLTSKFRILAYLSGVLSYLVILVSVFLLKANDFNQMLFDYFSLPVCLMSIALFIFVINIKFDFQKHFLKKIIISLSTSTFGIYLIHMFLLVQLYTRVLRFVPNPFFYIPILSILTFGSGYIITIILRRIPFISKYII